MSERHLDTSNDITLNNRWISQQVDRLVAWEMFCRIAKHEELYPIKTSDLCDKIGVNDQYFYRVLYNVKNKLNAK
jgi:hypothetical protein